MSKGHHHKSGKDYYVDTAFMNSIRGVLKGFELKHLGFGEFYLDGGKQGQIEFDRMRGKNFEGQSGRSHKLYDDKGGKLIAKLIKAMEKARASELVEGETLDLPLGLVESVAVLLEDSYSSGGFRIHAKKYAKKMADELRAPYEIHFWDPENKDSVQILLKPKGGLIQIEIEASWANGKMKGFSVGAPTENARRTFRVQWRGSMKRAWDEILDQVVGSGARRAA